MSVFQLNHAVLYVRDVERSVSFYQTVLGFQPVEGMDGMRGAVFLRAPGSNNDHDLGLFEVGPDAGPSMAGNGTVGLYHLAWEVETLDDLEQIARRLSNLAALVGTADHSTTKAVYAKDPDGIEFEVSWLVPADLLTDDTLAGRTKVRPLDLAKEKQRYGADTKGGIGVSVR